MFVVVVVGEVVKCLKLKWCLQHFVVGVGVFVALSSRHDSS